MQNYKKNMIYAIIILNIFVFDTILKEILLFILQLGDKFVLLPMNL